MTDFSLPNYEIKRELGKGGMATVYEAIQLPMERRVALKVLLPRLTRDEQFTARFLLEIKALAKFSHKNIVTIYDAGIQGDTYYIAMKLLEGGTFSDRIRQGCTTEQALSVVRGVAQALAISHAAGIIHRDVKPDNILFQDQDSYEPVLTDFGIAKDSALDSKVSLTEVDSVIGSPVFMSPEQALGKALDYRSDIFSLGVVLYSALTRQYPYTSSSIGELALAHQADAREPLSPQLQVLQPLVDAMLTIDKDKRHITPEGIIECIDFTSECAFDQAADDATIIQSLSSTASPPKKKKPVSKAPADLKKNKTSKLLAGTALILSLLALAVYLASTYLEPASFDSSRELTTGPSPAPAPAPEKIVTPPDTVGSYLSKLRCLPVYAKLTLSKHGNTLEESVALEPDDYELHASAPGYESSYISVRIPGDPPLIDLSLKQFLEIEEFYDYAATINGELSAQAFLSKYPASLMTRIIAIANSPNSDALQLLKRQAEDGDAPSQMQLSELYDYGIGVSKDTEKALFWSSKAAESGYAVAMLQRSSLILDYSDDPTEIENEIQTLEQLADQDFFLANSLLADIYLEGKHRKMNIDAALDYLERAAELGDPVARERLQTLTTNQGRK